MIWMSLKKTVIAFGNAYENPMEMKDPNTTAHPQPPSGGGTAEGPAAGGDITGPPQCGLFTAMTDKKKDKDKEQRLFLVCFMSCIMYELILSCD